MNIRSIAPKGMTLASAIALGFTPVKCGSHRARQHLVGRGSDAQGYWSFKRSTYHGVYAVKLGDGDRLPKNCTKLRGPFDDMGMCWS